MHNYILKPFQILLTDYASVYFFGTKTKNLKTCAHITF